MAKKEEYGVVRRRKLDKGTNPEIACRPARNVLNFGGRKSLLLSYFHYSRQRESSVGIQEMP